MKVLIEVPHYGQFLDIEDDYWKERTCGIVSLAMVLDYYDIAFDIKNLFGEALKIDNYDDKIGWKHQTIVDLAEKYGLLAERTEEQTIEKLLEALDNEEPVIISVYKNFNPSNGGHLIVLNGYFSADGNLEGFYVNDPIGNPYKNKDQFIKIDKFLVGWKKRAIYLKQKKSVKI
jgi:ABC-type bacteriocin/lantibiotic exporter with double-glycine peptidase domain